MFCQPLSKFGLSTFVVLYTMSFIVVFSLNGGANKIFGFLLVDHNFQRQGKPPLGLNYGTEVLIKKGFHLTHKRNIKKTKEVLRKPGKLSPSL